MIKAVIFDMDGLLIDSEPFWQEAEINVFGNINIPLTLEMKQETTGLRVNEVVEYWFAKYPQGNNTVEKVSEDIMKEMINLLKLKGKAMDGVEEIIKFFSQKNIPMAIASSSFSIIIDTALTKLGIKDKFQVIYSAENEKYGKPHPGVYIKTAEMMGVAPSECLAFEDSPNGVLSAKSAKMKCVAVPDIHLRGNKVYNIADLTVESLKDFTIEHFEKLSN